MDNSKLLSVGEALGITDEEWLTETLEESIAWMRQHDEPLASFIKAFFSASPDTRQAQEVIFDEGLAPVVSALAVLHIALGYVKGVQVTEQKLKKGES